MKNLTPVGLGWRSDQWCCSVGCDRNGSTTTTPPPPPPPAEGGSDVRAGGGGGGGGLELRLVVAWPAPGHSLV